MGIFERLKRLIKVNVNEVFDSRSVEDILNAGDEELKRIIEELNAPRQKKNTGSEQQNSSEQKKSQQGQNRRHQSAPPPRQSAHQQAVLNAYRVLGLKPTASVDEIKSAYRRFMMAYHPDRVMNQSTQKQQEAQRRAQEVNVAYEILQKVRGF